MPEHYAVSEIFGPTLQGEGPSAGRQAVFLRLAGCNLTCSWCDTPYTWDWTGRNGTKYAQVNEVHMMTFEAIMNQLYSIAGSESPMLVISGGEPMLQQLLVHTVARGWPNGKVEVETNGTVWPDENWYWGELHFNVSPKLPNSGNAKLGELYSRQVLGKYVDLDSTFKFVCQSVDDLKAVQNICEAVGIQPQQTWIMPEGRNGYELVERERQLVDEVIKRGWNFTSRMHVMLWGDVRGR